LRSTRLSSGRSTASARRAFGLCWSGDGNNDLHYLLAWGSLAERERVWEAFLADPAWLKARDDSERDGPIIANIKSAFLKPTAFSAVK
jgi:hypothetical protein